MMHTRVYIIHGWDACPDDAWYPWLKKELEKQGTEVHVPQMPYPKWPGMKRWVSAIHTAVGEADEQTYFVGHSLGSQAILRYIESLPDGTRIGGAVFVGGFEKVDGSLLHMLEAYVVITAWLLVPVRWNGLREKMHASVAIFSDDDTYVSVKNAHSFQRHLKSDILLLNGYGHFTGTNGVFAIPELLHALENMMHRHRKTRPSVWRALKEWIRWMIRPLKSS